MIAASFNIADRQREKNDYRSRDEISLAQEPDSAEDIAARNGFFSSLDASRARIVKRRVRIALD